MKLIENNNYRKDIDGLRAYAVLAVVIFHFGYLPNGFLGVDVFFVISGYLITGIIYRKISKNQFSIKDFYIRRTKRIIPLVSFICLISLILGVIFMLPDDLENLAQSIVATNFFNNNTLQVITTKNYWDVVNEFKPLMHTWSLAIEEQYYLFYPFLFILIAKIRLKLILPILIVLTLLSIGLFFSPFQDYYKFYLLPFRFFELSIGGIAAIILNGKIVKHRFSTVLIIALIVILYFDLHFINNDLLLFITVMITCGILFSDSTVNKLSSYLLENKLVVFIGKISFSIYMWHQIILAFGRYFLFHEIGFIGYSVIMLITTLLSIGTFYLIEQPFRHKFKTKNVFVILIFTFLITTGVSIYIYNNAGVLKDIPELGINKASAQKGIHAKYNDDIYKLDKSFTKTEKLKILVIGNSFARDWCNVLLESKFKERIEISYIYSAYSHPAYLHPDLKKRAKEADYIFLSTFSKEKFKKLDIDESKTWCTGTKNFGINNGIYYNYTGEDYCLQRTSLKDGSLKINDILKKEWGEKYIDLIDLVIDKEHTVPVFTPNCKFISQDTRHFTKYGAEYFAYLIENTPGFVLNKIDNKNNFR